MDDATTSQARACHVCGSVIPDDAPGAACPACELRDAFSTSDDLEGQTIDRYKILSRIGTGGFGVVYLAHQSEPVRRKVALKILKRDRINETIGAQFVAEQQALAVMNHPNIAKIFDAGETAWGAPYFVMELIEGEPITSYCDRVQLSPRERIMIFRDVCSAVQHAHQKAIIHRDLKPSNILVVEVDDRPQPKVIDFGVAKAMGTPLHDLVECLNNDVIGTPEYMPPEQARGESDIDTRADVYSLGILLYELLIGTPPFTRSELRDGGIRAILKLIELEQPPSPSERLDSMLDRGATVAQNRDLEPPSLRKLIRGDLDWIVMKAIEKSRKRRYQSATALAQDVDSYLQSRPLATRRKTPFYRARKFCRRNRALVGAAAVAVGVAMVGAIVVGTLWKNQRRERADALYQALFDCRVERLPSVVSAIAPYASILDPRLKAEAVATQRTPPERARAQLALYPRDPDQFAALADWLLEASPSDLGVFLGMLEGQEAGLPSLAWSVLSDGSAGGETHLRAAAIGAIADPDSSRWPGVIDQVAGQLVETGPYGAARWLPLLRPVGDQLAPAMRALYRAERDSTTGEMAAFVLSELYENDLGNLLSLVRTAGPRQLRVVAKVLGRDPENAERELFAALSDPSLDQANPEALDEHSRLALALLLLGRPDSVWPLLEHSPTPGLRSLLIHGAASYGVDWQVIAGAVDPAGDPGIVAAAVSALGGYDSAQLPISMREAALRPLLEDLFADASSSGVRSSAEWLLRHWGITQNLAALETPDRTGEPGAGNDWYVTSDGWFTMAVLPAPAEFTMGSSEEDLTSEIEREIRRPLNEGAHPETIGRRFAIATKEVTMDQFMEFATELEVTKKNLTPGGWQNPVSRSGDAAMSFVSLKEAMLFCRWYTRKTGIPESEQCYTFSGEKFSDAPEVSTVEGYLNKTGYRIMTEAEWEFACRGGTATPRPEGRGTRFLSQYAWFNENGDEQAHPPGLLRPNPYGIFDMLGNVCEWCQEPYLEQYRQQPTGEIIAVGEPIYRSDPAEGSWTVYRGASFYHGPAEIRSAWRQHTPYPAHPFSGFRIARTVGE